VDGSARPSSRLGRLSDILRRGCLATACGPRDPRAIERQAAPRAIRRSPTTPRTKRRARFGWWQAAGPGTILRGCAEAPIASKRRGETRPRTGADGDGSTARLAASPAGTLELLELGAGTCRASCGGRAFAKTRSVPAGRELACGSGSAARLERVRGRATTRARGVVGRGLTARFGDAGAGTTAGAAG
jgi:hypothetical protein